MMNAALAQTRLASCNAMTNGANSGRLDAPLVARQPFLQPDTVVAPKTSVTGMLE